MKSEYPTRTEPNRIHYRMGETGPLLALLGALLPKGVIFAGGGLQAWTPRLFDVEEAAVVRANERRRREFIAGRSYARAALAALGCPPCPIPAGPNRRPVWPDGYIGSISHTRRLCVVIAAKHDTYCGLGIDIEIDDGLENDLQWIICRPDERLPPNSLNLPEQELAKLVFVAKEAVFKAYNPTTNVFLEFSDVLIQFEEPNGSFRATLMSDHVPALEGQRCFRGRWGRIESHFIAAVTITRGSPNTPREGAAAC